jgi:hypothetical protein
MTNEQSKPDQAHKSPVKLPRPPPLPPPIQVPRKNDTEGTNLNSTSQAAQPSGVQEANWTPRTYQLLKNPNVKPPLKSSPAELSMEKARGAKFARHGTPSTTKMFPIPQQTIETPSTSNTSPESMTTNTPQGDLIGQRRLFHSPIPSVETVVPSPEPSASTAQTQTIHAAPFPEFNRDVIQVITTTPNSPALSPIPGVNVLSPLPPTESIHEKYSRPRKNWRLGRQPVTPSVSQPYTVLKYYDLTVPSQENDEDMYAHLFNEIEEFIGLIEDTDKTAKIFIHDEHDRRQNKSFIQGVDSFRAKINIRNVALLQKYFAGAVPKKNGKPINMKILMGGASPSSEYKEQLEAWAQNGHWFGVRPLQMQNTMEVGWGLFSVRKTDPDALAAETSSFCGFPVGCHWKKIASRGVPSPGSPTVQAIHFSVDIRYQAHDRTILTRVFHHTKSTGFPLGIFTWFVPVANHTREDDHSDALAAYYKGKQEDFCVKNFNSDTIMLDFHTINKVNETLGKTIREYVMNIKTRNDPKVSLFLAINKHYKYSNWVVVSYKPRHKREAAEVLDGLLNYMRYYEKPTDQSAFDSMFVASTVVKANAAQWDPVQYRVRNDTTDQYETMKDNMKAAYDQELLSEDEDEDETPMPCFEHNLNEVADDETVHTTTTHVPTTNLPPDNPRTNEEIQQQGIALASRPSVSAGVPFVIGEQDPNATNTNSEDHYETGLLTQPSSPPPNPAPPEGETSLPSNEQAY